MGSEATDGKSCSAFGVSLLFLAAAGCAPAEPPPFGDAERGRGLMAQYQCGSCHTIPGVDDAQGKFATTLQAFGQRSYIAGRVPNVNDALARWIVDPASVIPDTTMPNMGVSQTDARDIVAYLRGLR